MPNTTTPDFYDVDGLLTEDERQVRDTVGKFVDRRILPHIQGWFEEGRFPTEIIPEMAELGLFGSNFSDYDCAGLNSLAYGLMMQELERGDGGLRSFASVQSGLVMYPIHTWGSEEQKDRWLPEMAAGRAIGCFGLTEPDGGSDPGTMRTHAEQRKGDWVLNGAKAWITNGTIADVAVVWAKTDQGIRGFLVEKGTKGFTSSDIEHKFSLRASVTSDLYFDNCKVPDENVLPDATGLSAPLGCLNQARYGIAWGAVGAAMACYREALEFCHHRELFGTPLSHKQTIQVRLADMVRQITLGQLLVMQLGRLKDTGEIYPTQVSLAKWSNVRMALDVAREARDILGAGGISVECSPIRHMLNLESVITYEGTETIHQLVVGRDITGVSAF